MGIYRDRVHYEPHDFNSTSVLVKGTIQIKGLQTLEVEKTSDTFTVGESEDGMALPKFHASRVGTIKFSFMEASETMDLLEDLLATNVPFSVVIADKNAPKFDVSSVQSTFKKPAVKKRLKGVDFPEFEIVCTYLDCRGGSYKLAAI